MWRPIKREDIKRGTVIRLTKMIEQGGYGMATVLAVHEMGHESYPHVIVGRPFAYAAEHYDSNQPLLGCEVYDISISNLLRDSEEGYYHVYQERDRVLEMVT